MLHYWGQSVAIVPLCEIDLRIITLTGAWFDVRAFEGDAFVVQQVGLIAGLAPTLSGKLQDALDASVTGAADMSGAAFTQVSSSNNHQKMVFRPNAIRGWIRYIGTIGGTTPSITFGATLFGIRKYS